MSSPTPELVERHPGPFIGPDAELARACAMVTIPYYGNDTPEEYQRILAGKIWNDHIAVQTALTAIHSIRKALEREKIARIIDPDLYARWDRKRETDRKADKWFELTHPIELAAARAKADTILGLLPLAETTASETRSPLAKRAP